MVTLYTLNQSRSHRIAWLLEELGINYHAERFERDSQTRLAPAELKNIHPLGKAPMIKDSRDGVEKVIIESGAIVEYLINHYDERQTLKPEFNSLEYDEYLQWIHYSEGSITFALVASMYAGENFTEFCQAQIGLHIGYVEQHLANKFERGQQWIVSNTLTGADILMSFPLQVISLKVSKEQCPNIHRFVEQVESNSSYLKADKRIGKLNLAKLNG